VKRAINPARDIAATAVATILIALPLALLVEAIVRLTAWLMGEGPWHIGWAGAGALLVLCWIPGRQVGPAAIARYDEGAMLPCAPGSSTAQCSESVTLAQQHAWDAILRWCHRGAGDGSSPLLLPWVFPKAEERFSVAVLAGPKGADKSRLVEAFCRHLDGNEQLSKLASRWARWRVKLRVKAVDCAWWLERKPDHPWDCGFLVEDDAAHECLDRFLPRRSTLFIAEELSASAVAACIDRLDARRGEFRYPVRVLIVDTDDPGGLGMRWSGRGERSGHQTHGSLIRIA